MAKEEITPSEWQIMEVLWACGELLFSKISSSSFICSSVSAKLCSSAAIAFVPLPEK